MLIMFPQNPCEVGVSLLKKTTLMVAVNRKACIFVFNDTNSVKALVIRWEYINEIYPPAVQATVSVSSLRWEYYTGVPVIPIGPC